MEDITVATPSVPEPEVDVPLLPTPKRKVDADLDNRTPKPSIYPTIVSIGLLGTSLAALLVGVVYGHIQTIPRISECGVQSPERNILGFGFLIVGLSFTRMARLVFGTVEQAIDEPSIAHVTLSLCILCAFSCLGIAVAPLSNYEDETTLDEMTCVLFLSLALLCSIIQLAIRGNAFQAGLVVAGVLSAMGFVLLKVVGFREVRSLLEWVCLVLLCGYLITAKDVISDEYIQKKPRVSELDQKSLA